MENRLEISEKEKQLMERHFAELAIVESELGRLRQKGNDFFSIMFASRGVDLPTGESGAIIAMRIEIVEGRIELVY